MIKKSLHLKELRLKDVEPVESEQVTIGQISNKDIAVIGIAGVFPGASNLDEFWESLCQGRDCVTPFPAERKVDTEAYLRATGKDSNVAYHEGGYIKEIDKFDPLFFKISPKEASLMDPNQRLFLETAYQAMENGGYGGNRLSGTQTGVYVGFSSDTSTDYRRFIADIEPSSINISVPGNIKSIIASRIAYFLDLKGPSMLVDTACSSALVALHLACSDLQNQRCEMAIAGGVKLTLMPINSGSSGWLNIRSSISRARTFDDRSDGTGLGEGAGAVLLKPLVKALEDRDHIYAVIKGSAVNQDGNSIGITAPNSLAQADVIEMAWRDAEIDPETITYIEAHGTGTPLGDPIEIDGMTKAFRRHTDKKQFCGVGAVKTNIGHLDNAAGIAGLFKAVLALRHRKLPPTVHFQKPNSKIRFTDSPVYVVDRLTPWESKGFPLRCGISSFGLSGTNCHVVLEEAPSIHRIKGEAAGLQVLTLSGKSKKTLMTLVKEYRECVASQPELDLEDLCFTANTGRNHFTDRLAVLFHTREELIARLQQIEEAGLSTFPDGVYYGEHRVVGRKDGSDPSSEITEWEKQERSTQSKQEVRQLAAGISAPETGLPKLCQLYVAGADVPWDELYRGANCYRIPLPGYPFERKRCWLEAQPQEQKTPLTTGIVGKYSKEMDHPLLDVLLAESLTQDLYVTEFSVERQWVLKEHRVGEHYVVPGTTYLEMARALAERYNPALVVQLEEVYFLTPFIVAEGEVREVQTIIQKGQDSLEFTVASKTADEQWIRHVQGKITGHAKTAPLFFDLSTLQSRCTNEGISYPTRSRGSIHVGPRWKNIRNIAIGTNELLAEVVLPEEFLDDLQEYPLHPALLDMAVNVVTQKIGEGLYLPFSYRLFTISAPMPARFYSYLVRKEKGVEHLETATFDIYLIDEQGHVFAQAEDYTVKKVHQADFRGLSGKGNTYFEMGWIREESPLPAAHSQEGTVLILTDEKGWSGQISHALRLSDKTVIEVEFGDHFEKVDAGRYIVRGTEEEYAQVLAEEKVARILFFTTMADGAVESLDELVRQQERGVDQLFFLTRALVKGKVDAVDLVLIADYANRVTGEEPWIHPHHASVFGLGKVVGQEYTNLPCRCIDMDDETPLEMLLAEINCQTGPFQIAYRRGLRYREEFRKVDLRNRPDRKIEIKPDGVYLITGGMGGIGLEIAQFLAKEQHVHLALVNRTALPERDQWDAILAADGDAKLCQRIRTICELEATGSTVHCYQADVANLAAMEQVIQDVHDRYGRIHGVVHSAGVAGDGFIIRKEKGIFDQVMAPKVYGTWILDQLTQEDQPDFFLLFSSITALLGGPGQGDYTAANAYLDAYAAAGKGEGRHLTTINWPAWKETGMAVDYGVSHDLGIFKSIGTAKALSALEEVLQKDVTHVLAAELNLDHEIFASGHFPIAFAAEIKTDLERWRKRSQPQNKTKAPAKRVTVVLQGRSSGEYSETERALAQVWTQVLALDEVDIFADFYTLGGDSILAIRISNAIQEALKKKVDISDLFEYLTIAKLAEYLDGKGTATETSLTKSTLPPAASSYVAHELSNAQRRIWFLQKFEPNLTAYNLPTVARLHNPLDIAKLEKALNVLVQRHSGLRTIFKEEGGIPQQVILDQVSLSIRVVDLTTVSEKEERLREALHADYREVFDLSKPLLKVKAYQLGESEYCLFTNIHHIITDGWSMNVFSRELMELYYAEVNGVQTELPPLQMSYMDWIEEQKIWMQTDEFREMEGYWLRELEKPLPVLNLPTDYPRPQKQTYNGSYFHFTLQQDLTRRLKGIARESNSTLHMLLLSAYALLLYKLTQDEDIIIGVPMTGRDRAELENVFGLFVNTICIRVRYANLRTFDELLQQVRVKSLQGYKNSKYPFDHLVMQLNPERDFSRPPVYSTLFQLYENIPAVNENVTLFDLSFLGRETAQEEIEIRMEYNPDLFTRETIERFSQYYTTLIEEINADYRQPLAGMELLSQREKEAVLARFSRIGDMPLPASTVHGVFERQVSVQPDATALLSDGERLSYGELNARANQLARILVREGVTPNEPVGIMIGRKPEMIVGLLGILKAGGAYVPIDPDYPIGRISYMLQHSETRILVTEEVLLPRVAELGEHQVCTVVDLTGDTDVQIIGVERVYTRPTLQRESDENLSLTYRNQNLMYIIYTSGSTGLPKGVMVSHSNALNYLLWSIQDGGLGVGDRMLLVTSMSFDISVFEIFGALLSGASLSILPAETLRDGNALLHHLKAHQITIWHSVPTLMAQLLIALRNRKGNREGLDSVRQIMIGGEAWSVELAREIRQHFPQAEILNMYGPTEATIWVTSYRVGDDLEQLVTLPIGQPIANNQILILDANRQVCPIGIPGDLYVSGANVTAGYYKDPEKTAQAFIIDSTGTSLYQTGDQARYLANGQIEYLGRADGMVKVRGYRIEVGEIENVLLTHDRIDAVAVVTKKEGDTHKLVCYYTTHGEPTVDELREFVSQTLPSYMIPAQWIAIDAMPLTPNGKIDKKTLAQMEIVIRPTLESAYTLPGTEAEQFLVAVWQELLGMEQVGIHDNFFALGGNSFLATQMHAKIEERYPDTVTIVDIFTYPSIEKLAKYLTQDQSSTELVAVTQVEEEKGEHPTEAEMADELMSLFDAIEKGKISVEEATRKIEMMEVKNE